MRSSTKEAYQLLQDGLEALSRVEHNGIRIDVDYLDSMINKTTRDILKIQKEMEADTHFLEWKKFCNKKGNEHNPRSRRSLGNFLVNGLGVTISELTETGKYKTDETVLNKIDLPLLKLFSKAEKLHKVKTTYLQGIRREVVNGFLHPSFNLNTVVTFRGSSSNPNFQNIPIRNKEYAALIRKAFIPRRGYVLSEVDYSGIEVKIAACYHKDENLLSYINDPTKDMHRDMAMECYLLNKKEVNKDIRYCAKNRFVFPEFYGSYYGECAEDLWNAIDSMNLQVDGISLKKHLRNNGIKSLGSRNSPAAGTFQYHIKQVENKFWNERFFDYKEWKIGWYKNYLRRGGFRTLTGFWIEGLYKRNDVINYPVQGSAFHCLLWSLIEMNKFIQLNGMKSMIVGQIHDSIIADVHEKEIQEYHSNLNNIMTKKIKKHWDWIIVPLDTEIDIADDNWHNKKQWKFVDGVLKEVK